MSTSMKEEAIESRLNMDDEEDALLNEAICCSRNTQIEDPNTSKIKHETSTELSKTLWSEMESDSSSNSIKSDKFNLSNESLSKQEKIDEEDKKCLKSEVKTKIGENKFESELNAPSSIPEPPGTLSI